MTATCPTCNQPWPHTAVSLLLSECKEKGVPVYRGHLIRMKEDGPAITGLALHTLENWLSTGKLERYRLAGPRVYLSLREIAELS